MLEFVTRDVRRVDEAGPVVVDPWFPNAWRGSPFDGFHDLLKAFAMERDWPSLSELERRWLRSADVRTETGEPLRLVAQPTKLRRAKPRSRNALYDVAVCKGELPTRANNWHDFFNVMMFAAFPSSKRLLHARQRRILEQRLPNEVARLPGERTVEQDCLTILDEGGVLLAADVTAAAHLDKLLEQGDHGELLNHVDAGRLRPWLFGHAHAEELVKQTRTAGSTPLGRAKSVLLAIGADAPRTSVDAALAKLLTLPDFCSQRDCRRAVALEDLYLDLSVTEG